MNVSDIYICFIRTEPRVSQSGAHPCGGEGPSPPWDLKNTIFSRFLPLNYAVLHFRVLFFKFFFSMWEDYGSLQDHKKLT